MRKNRRLREEGGLLLTPLIDIIFLVVIFFMLNTSLSMNHAIQIDLPAAYTARAVLTDEIVVTLSGEGNIFIGSERIGKVRFAARLKEEMVKRQTDHMILQADRDLAYRHLVDIMDLARLTGIVSISLVTAQKSLP